jgi:2-dehydro-3-deoxy-D-arabinonate dehydratase
MKLYRTTQGFFVEQNGRFSQLPTAGLDDLLADGDFFDRIIQETVSGKAPVQSVASLSGSPLPIVQSQEVWAAGVTYYRSRNARMEESKDAGGGDFYDRVYAAQRPELFFKSPASRVLGPGSPVRIRRDAKWSVPEPELTLVIHSSGTIVGYTIGNDMSSRDIEGENPLYLPQAKVYNGSCAVGPCILFSGGPLASTTAIRLEILRGGKPAFDESTTLASLKRDPKELAEYLYRELDFPHGALLMTGTGIVPPDAFTLQSGDVIRISIDGIGTLENPVA